MKHETPVADIVTTLALTVRPNGRVQVSTIKRHLPQEHYLGGYLYLDFRPGGFRLYFLLPETEYMPGSELVLAANDRYDLSLAMRLERQKLVDVLFIEKLSFDGIQNFMATCRLFR